MNTQTCRHVSDSMKVPFYIFVVMNAKKHNKFHTVDFLIEFYSLQSDKSQWKMFFYTAIAVYLLANVVFVVCGSGELQPWDSYGTEKSITDHARYESDKVLKIFEKNSKKNKNCNQNNPEHQVFLPTDDRNQRKYVSDTA